MNTVLVADKNSIHNGTDFSWKNNRPVLEPQFRHLFSEFPILLRQHLQRNSFQYESAANLYGANAKRIVKLHEMIAA